MNAPIPEGTVVPAADEESYPFAQDLDGTWHRRPHGDTWTVSLGDHPNCRTACGQAIHSVHVSEYQPEPDPSAGATLCECVSAAAPKPPAASWEPPPAVPRAWAEWQRQLAALTPRVGLTAWEEIPEGFQAAFAAVIAYAVSDAPQAPVVTAEQLAPLLWAAICEDAEARWPDQEPAPRWDGLDAWGEEGEYARVTMIAAARAALATLGHARPGAPVTAEELATVIRQAYGTAVAGALGTEPPTMEDAAEIHGPDGIAVLAAGWIAAARAAQDRLGSSWTAWLERELNKSIDETALLRAQLAGQVAPAEYAAEAGAALAIVAERELPPDVQLAACPAHEGSEHVQVRTHGHRMCVVALRGLDDGWAALEADRDEEKNARLHMAGERDAARADFARLAAYFTQGKQSGWTARISGTALRRMCLHAGISEPGGRGTLPALPDPDGLFAEWADETYEEIGSWSDMRDSFAAGFDAAVKAMDDGWQAPAKPPGTDLIAQIAEERRVKRNQYRVALEHIAEVAGRPGATIISLGAVTGVARTALEGSGPDPLARIREVIGRYHAGELNAVAAFGDIVRLVEGGHA